MIKRKAYWIVDNKKKQKQNKQNQTVIKEIGAEDTQYVCLATDECNKTGIIWKCSQWTSSKPVLLWEMMIFSHIEIH